MRYVNVVAKDHYEAGYRLGKLTAKLQRSFLKAFPLPRPWNELIGRSKPFLRETKQIFPQYIEEVRGLAHGASVPFDYLWVIQCLDELEHRSFIEKCSSVFIKKENGGYIVGHNEDWDLWTKPYYFIQRRTVDRKTVLELGMPGVISGGTVSINSYGVMQTINTLYHSDFQVGVPRMIVARWLSGKRSIEDVKRDFPKLRRAAGYCFNICDGTNVLSIEASAKRYSYIEPEENYVHTNHYTTKLKEIEQEDDEKPSPSRLRYGCISVEVGRINSVSGLQSLLLLKKDDESSVYRTSEVATVASFVFEPEKRMCHVTQENKGKDTNWEDIPLDFLSK
jgi:predicted choloylglycine hydrolase